MDGNVAVARFRQGGFAMLVQVHTGTIRGTTAAIETRTPDSPGRARAGESGAS
jgi:hypothetical protein